MENTDIVKLVLEFIEKTGSAIILTGFPIAVKYVIAEGISKITYGSIGLFSFIYGLVNWIRVMHKADLEENENIFVTNKQAFITIAMTILGILGFFMSFSLFTGVKMLISPEWYAILNIIDLVK